MSLTVVTNTGEQDIYDMFDSLFLLGVGGRTVYHGPATECKGYFEQLGFRMKEGESQADRFLDISSGDVSEDIEAMGINKSQSITSPSSPTNANSAEDCIEDSLFLDKPSNKDETLAKARTSREKLYRSWNVHFENLPSSTKARYFDPPEVFSLPITPTAVSGWRQFLVQLRRNCLLSWRNRDSRLLDCVILLIAGDYFPFSCFFLYGALSNY